MCWSPFVCTPHSTIEFVVFFQLGLVCFRLIGSDKLNEKLLSNINASGKLHMVPASVNEKYIIRFCAVAQNACEEDIGMECSFLFFLMQLKMIPILFAFNLEIAWDIITDFATELLEKEQADEVTEILDRKRKETLAQKRSFFVRMVSDPKIYNPAINKAGSTPRMSTDNYSPIIEGTPTIQTPRRLFHRFE